jgi:hypothetical protein
MSSTALIPKPLSVQIQALMDAHQIDELKNFISRRSCLNKCNLFLIYFFHLVQSAGILTTTIATGYNLSYLIWVGVGLNILASLLNIYEKNNANILKKLEEEIEDIREGKPVEEATIEDAAEAPPAPAPPSTLVKPSSHSIKLVQGAIAGAAPFLAK